MPCIQGKVLEGCQSASLLTVMKDGQLTIYGDSSAFYYHFWLIGFDLVAFYLSRSTNFLKIPVPGSMGVYSTDHCSLAVNTGGALIAC